MYFVLLQLLVYVGALAILFLFVVMLLDIPSTEILAHQRGTYPVAAVWVFVELLLLYWHRPNLFLRVLFKQVQCLQLLCSTQ
jgi:NADH:ubiquinone oxidoreductase subunit 6 (subunit J)